MGRERGKGKYLSRVKDLLDISQGLVIFSFRFEGFNLLLCQNLDVAKLYINC